MRLSVPLVLVAALAGACAALDLNRDRQDPDREFDRALAAWRTGDYRSARHALLRVYNGFAERPVGQRALLALAAAELDPRNPDRRLDAASAFAARYIHEPGVPEWSRPVAEALYLLALDLGAREAAPVPALPDTPLAARLHKLELRGDSLEARIGALERKLAEREQELERIRKTLTR